MGAIAATWGAFGFIGLLVCAIYRLSAIAIDGLTAELGMQHWLVLVVAIGFMAYFEGYRGFQKRYSPRFAARTQFLRSNPTPLRSLLAPLFCMGFFGAPKRRVISAFVLTLSIILLVLLFHRLPQPWRGILDAAVIVGLLWGATATTIEVLKARSSDAFAVDPEVTSPAVSK